MASTSIVWLRRDLRIHDHPALSAAAGEDERVLPLYVLDERMIGGRFASGPRYAFLLGCLRELDAELKARGAGLCVVAGRPEEVVPSIALEVGAQAVHWTSDVSPFALRRDGCVTEALRDGDVRARPHGGNYCIDVSQPRTGSGNPYTVFTPFWKAWQRVERRAVLEAPERLALPDCVPPGGIPDRPRLEDELREPFCIPGERAARAAAGEWLADGIDDYAARHDDLAHGTSGLSPYLRWGCLSARELEERAGRIGGEGAAAFTRQLAWRDFYAHVLLMHPHTGRLEFQERMRGLEWEDDPELLEAWKAGRTGYPVVDAAMRQLAATGWMHNRARLIVGSFLTKDLHVDWREGELWFERLLLDGEQAQNNGNWQWIASTGVDPAPYFRRMFNPTTQQRKFDPTGAYVRRWVPELRAVPDARIDEPWKMTADEQRAAGCIIGDDYPAPVVDHAVERRAAIERYRSVAAD